MTTTLPPLDAEQQVALAQLAGDKTSENWGRDVLLGIINEQVNRNIDTRGAQLLEAAKALPKEKRLAYTEQATQLLENIAQS